MLGFVAPPSALNPSHRKNLMKSESALHSGSAVDLRPLKEKLKKKLPSNSPVLLDLLREPDSMSVESAEILIPHYLRRLEGELERYETARQLVLRS
jgi:hypothetical protein